MLIQYKKIMSEKFALLIASKLGIQKRQAHAVIQLLNEGATIPFIARYRKEATQGLDEVQVISIKDQYETYIELEERRAFIIKTIDEQGNMNAELLEKLSNALSINQLEDIYLPFKPKRKTRATVAKEKGLEPLARLIYEQEINTIEAEASKYLNAELLVNTIDEAIAGAKDIIAEWISENEKVRETLRNIYKLNASIKSTVRYGKKEIGEKFQDYFNWEEPLAKCPSHRLLAIFRGENEGILGVDIVPDEEQAIVDLSKIVLLNRNGGAQYVKQALADSYKRLLQPSIESEYRMQYKKLADQEAINVFASNIKELLLAAPLGQKRIIAIDPGFKSGCKVVVLNEQGKLMHETVIYPHPPQQNTVSAEIEIQKLCEKYNIEAIAIGNGTAGKETEHFIKNNKHLSKDILVISVNESGASIYSASEVAREEFPDYDLTVRGAVSIGRRLADPLAELVKIDPKSIGVGQYQHDVDQSMLKKKLEEVVTSCVNNVGVELNTASKQLLMFVAGLGPALANNIVNYRDKNGAFNSRKQLLEVPRMGEKAYEQCAGFLRIHNAKNILDTSAVHPESYELVTKMAKDLNCDVNQLMYNKDLITQIKPEKYYTEKIGAFTLKDILLELEKPGRDPREQFEIFEFDQTVNKIDDVVSGMELPGVITNVTKFGAFVDIGVHQDGLIHISEISNTYVADPSTVLRVGQKVQVLVIEVEVSRKRIALSMKGVGQKNNKTKQITSKNTSKTNIVKENTAVANTMEDALTALRNKFGK